MKLGLLFSSILFVMLLGSGAGCASGRGPLFRAFHQPPAISNVSTTAVVVATTRVPQIPAGTNLFNILVNVVMPTNAVPQTAGRAPVAAGLRVTREAQFYGMPDVLKSVNVESLLLNAVEER